MKRDKDVNVPLIKTIRHSLKPTALIPEIPDNIVLKGVGKSARLSAACRRELFRRTSVIAQDYQQEVLTRLLSAAKLDPSQLEGYLNRGEFQTNKNLWKRYIDTWRAQLVTTSMPHKLLALGFTAYYVCEKNKIEPAEKHELLVQLEALSLNLESLPEVSLGLIRIMKKDVNFQKQFIDKLLTLLLKNDETVQSYAIAALKKVLPFVKQKKETYLKICDLLTADMMLDENVLDEIIVCLKSMWENKWVDDKAYLLSGQAALLVAGDEGYRAYRAKRIIIAVWSVLSSEDEKLIRIAVNSVLKENQSPELIELLGLFYISTTEEMKKESLRGRINGFLQHENPALRYAAIKAIGNFYQKLDTDKKQPLIETLVLLTQDINTYVSIEAIKMLRVIIPELKKEKEINSIFNALYEMLLPNEELSEQEIIAIYGELAYALKAIWKKLNNEQQTKIITFFRKNTVNLTCVVMKYISISELLWPDLSDDLKGNTFKLWMNILENGGEKEKIAVTEVFSRLWSTFISQKNSIFELYEKILTKSTQSDSVKNAVVASLVVLWKESNDRISLKICNLLLNQLENTKNNVLQYGALKGLITLWPDLSEDTQAVVFTFINRKSADHSQHLEKIAVLTAQNWAGLTAKQTEIIFELIWSLHAVKDSIVCNAVLDALVVMFKKFEVKQQTQIIEFIVASLTHPASEVQEKAAIYLMLACPNLDKEKTQVEAVQMERQVFEILTREESYVHEDDRRMALATLISQSNSAEQYMQELTEKLDGNLLANFIFSESYFTGKTERKAFS